jgi:hypothetical protein
LTEARYRRRKRRTRVKVERPHLILNRTED